MSFYAWFFFFFFLCFGGGGVNEKFKLLNKKKLVRWGGGGLNILLCDHFYIFEHNFKIIKLLIKTIISTML